MNRSPLRRLSHSAAVLLIVLALLPLPAGAAPREGAFFSPWRLLTTLWGALGSVFDPDGGPSDYGSVVDPSGRATPEIVVGNYGSVVDPNGRPNENGDSDLGSTFDPSGQPNR